ncbi:hypothetical protein Hanom_Chr17g01588401 [Helianthus anomalus]
MESTTVQGPAAHNHEEAAPFLSHRLNVGGRRQGWRRQGETRDVGVCSGATSRRTGGSKETPVDW